MKVGDNGKMLDTLSNVNMFGDIREKKIVCLIFGAQWKDVEKLGNVKDVRIFWGDKGNIIGSTFGSTLGDNACGKYTRGQQ